MIEYTDPELEAIVTLDGTITYDIVDETGVARLKRSEFLEAISLDVEQHPYIKGWLTGDYKREEQPTKQGMFRSVLSRVPVFRKKTEPTLDLSSLLQEVEEEEQRIKRDEKLALMGDKLKLIGELSKHNQVFVEWVDNYYGRDNTRINASPIIDNLRDGEIPLDKFRGFYRTIDTLEDKNAIESTIDLLVESMTPNEILVLSTEKERELKEIATKYVATHYLLLAEVYLLMNRKIYSAISGDIASIKLKREELETLEKAVGNLRIDQQSFENLFGSYAYVISRYVSNATREITTADEELTGDEYSIGQADEDLNYTKDFAINTILYLEKVSLRYLQGKGAFSTDLEEAVSSARIATDVTIEEEYLGMTSRAALPENSIEVGSTLPSAEQAPVLEGGELEDTRDPPTSELSIAQIVEGTCELPTSELPEGIVEETGEGKKNEAEQVIIPPPLKKEFPKLPVPTHAEKEGISGRFDDLESYFDIISGGLGEFVAVAGNILSRYVDIETDGIEPNKLANLLQIYANAVDKAVQIYETRLAELGNQVETYRSLLGIEANTRVRLGEDLHESQLDNASYVEGLERLTVKVNQLYKDKTALHDIILTNRQIRATLEERDMYLELLTAAEIDLEETYMLQTEETQRLEELLESAMVSIAAGEKVILNLKDAIDVYETRLSERDQEVAHVISDLDAARDERDRAIEGLEAKTTRVGRLETELGTTIGDLGRAREELGSKTTRIGKLEIELGATREERDVVNGELSRVRTDYEGALERISELEVGTTETTTVSAPKVDVISNTKLSDEDIEKIYAELRNLKLAVHFDSGLLGALFGQSEGVFYTANAIGIDTKKYGDYGLTIRYSPIIDSDNEENMLHRFVAKGLLFESDALDKGGYLFSLVCNYKKQDGASNIFVLDEDSIDLRVIFDYGIVFSVAAFLNENTVYSRKAMDDSVRAELMNTLNGRLIHETKDGEQAYITGDLYTVNNKIAAGLQGAPDKKKAEYHLRVTDTIK